MSPAGHLFSRKELLYLLIAATSATTIPARAQTAALAPAVVEAESTPNTNNAPAFTVGDRLKITFFETLRSDPGRKNLLSSLIEHPELSGEYVIQNDGRIFLPFVGDVLVAGHTQAAFARSVEAAISDLFGSPIKLIVQILEREPIYVTGPVARPGTFKYVPGMTVLHAIALAGGADGTSNDQWSRFEMTREHERIQKSRERLARLLASRDVLVAERDGNRPTPSQQLIDLVGESAGSRIIAREEQMRTLELHRLSNEEEAIDAIDQASRKELRALRERTAQIEIYLKGKSEYVQTLSNMRTSGVVTETNFHVAQSELNTVRERWHEIRSTIAQLERKLIELHHQKTRGEFDEKIKREQLIKSVQSQIMEERITQATLGRLNFEQIDVSNGGSGNAAIRFRIVRRTASGVEHLDSTRTSLFETLWPGDVLQLGRSSSTTVGAAADADRRTAGHRTEGRSVE